MDNERPNEFNTWRHRLEEPGALPGIGLSDKEAAWDKLYERLGEARRRRTPVWIWAAAACILLALIPAAILLSPSGKRVDQPITQAPLRNPVTAGAKAPSASKTSDNTPSVAQTDIAVPKTPDRPRPVAQAELVSQPIKRSNTPHHPTLLLSPIQSLKLAPAPDSFYPGRPDLSPSIPMVIAAAPSKKELRVIHINELEPPHPATSTAGRRQKAGRLYITLTPEQEPFRPATTFEPPTDHPIINFKH